MQNLTCCISSKRKNKILVSLNCCRATQWPFLFSYPLDLVEFVVSISSLTSARSQPGRESRRLVTNTLPFLLSGILPLSPFLYRFVYSMSHYNIRDESDIYVKETLSFEVCPRKNFLNFHWLYSYFGLLMKV